MKQTSFSLSVVVPLYNEAAGLRNFHERLLTSIKATTNYYEIIYCDDGSQDESAALIADLASSNPHVKLLKFTRNFGKESATSAGIIAATGDCVFILDADGQHPPELLPEFVKAWQSGNAVVVGMRQNRANRQLFKKIGSGVYYRLNDRMTGSHNSRGNTDFRMIDHEVRDAFAGLHDTDRSTRGLIDWLGYKTSYIEFMSPDRQSGEAAYSSRKLINLAVNALIANSPLPMYIFGYIGIVITGTSLLLGSIVFFEQIILEDPLNWNFTGTAMLSILLLFLVGIILMAQGMMALYTTRILNQSRQRPLYVIDQAGSINLNKK